MAKNAVADTRKGNPGTWNEIKHGKEGKGVSHVPKAAELKKTYNVAGPK